MENFKLTDHFSFFEFTQTGNTALQDLNRQKGLAIKGKLTAIAEVLEVLREELGHPLEIHSAFRCAELNGATAGSSKTSQHMLGEAVDFSGPGQEDEAQIDAFWKKVLGILQKEGIAFGQLIKESAGRDHGRSNWVHLSLGAPHREVAKCGQVMTMRDGTYTLVKTVTIGDGSALA